MLTGMLRGVTYFKPRKNMASAVEEVSARAGVGLLQVPLFCSRRLRHGVRESSD